MIQTLDTPLEIPQDLSLAPVLPASDTPDIAPFGFVPAPTVSVPTAPASVVPAPIVPAPIVSVDPPIFTDQTISTSRPAPLVRPQRRVRIDWYQIAVIFLILSCAALCIYRLASAVQP